MSIRDQEGVHAVALAGALAGGSGVALVSAVTPDSPLNAGALIDDAKKTVGGGGKPADDLSVAGGKHVEQIDAALDRIKAGTYGICTASGKSIPQERLRAIPWAAERVEYKVGGLGNRL